VQTQGFDSRRTKPRLDHFYRQDAVPTFLNVFKEVGIVPISTSLLLSMENRHKFAKKGKTIRLKVFATLSSVVLGELGVLAVK